MKVQIEGNLYLESDTYQFILKEYTGKFVTDKDGVEREQYKTLGYYTDLGSALKFFITMKVKETTAQTLSELVSDVEALRRYIESKFEYEVVPRAAETLEEAHA